MAQNITLLGASYTDVPGVQLPKTGGGTALFSDASITTATASDVASGKLFLASNGVITTGTNSGGGASNFVTGTFKGTTSGSILDVTLNYSGSGYPIAAIIYPKEGFYKTDGAYRSLIQRYAVGFWAGATDFTNLVPDFGSSGDDGKWVVMSRYKSSTTNAASFQNGASSDAQIMVDENPTQNASACVKIRSKTKMSVYIASTSYGFAANIEYTYHIIYSS